MIFCKIIIFPLSYCFYSVTSPFICGCDDIDNFRKHNTHAAYDEKYVTGFIDFTKEYWRFLYVHTQKENIVSMRKFVRHKYFLLENVRRELRNNQNKPRHPTNPKCSLINFCTNVISLRFELVFRIFSLAYTWQNIIFTRCKTFSFNIIVFQVTDNENFMTGDLSAIVVSVRLLFCITWPLLLLEHQTVVRNTISTPSLCRMICRMVECM